MDGEVEDLAAAAYLTVVGVIVAVFQTEKVVVVAAVLSTEEVVVDFPRAENKVEEATARSASGEDFVEKYLFCSGNE